MGSITSFGLRAALLASLGVGLWSCKSGEPWMFAATRHVWTEGIAEEWVEEWREDTDPDDPLEALAVCLLVCPIAIDVALLPITVTHDLTHVD